MRFSEQAMLEISKGRMNHVLAASRELSGYVKDEFRGEVWPLLRNRKVLGPGRAGGALARITRFLRGTGYQADPCIASSEATRHE